MPARPTTTATEAATSTGTGSPADGTATAAPSAYDRAGTGDDPRCRPVQLDQPAPIGQEIDYPDYGEPDQQTWRELYARQVALLDRLACRDFLLGLEAMGFDPQRIPDLREVDGVLQQATGWRVARIPGLLHERDFFAFLAERVFPCTDYIRPPHELDYTPAPDLFHDIFGHTPMITNPVFADFYQRMGRAALKAAPIDARRLERFYWFTVEFGLIREQGEIRVFGNGILSSFGESQHALSGAVEQLEFDPAAIVEQEYDVWHFQERLYVIDSFEQLAEGFDRWAMGRGLL